MCSFVRAVRVEVTLKVTWNNGEVHGDDLDMWISDRPVELSAPLA